GARYDVQQNEIRTKPHGQFCSGVEDPITGAEKIQRTKNSLDFESGSRCRAIEVSSCQYWARTAVKQRGRSGTEKDPSKPTISVAWDDEEIGFLFFRHRQYRTRR